MQVLLVDGWTGPVYSAVYSEYTGTGMPTMPVPVYTPQKTRTPYGTPYGTCRGVLTGPSRVYTRVFLVLTGLYTVFGSKSAILAQNS